MKKNISKVLIFALCAMAIAGISAILFDLHGEIQANILLTSATIFTFCIPMLASASTYENPKYKLTSKIGVGVSVATCIYIILRIWDVFGIKFNLKLLFTLILLSFSFGHILLILSVKNDVPTINMLKKVVVIGSILIDIMISSIWLISAKIILAEIYDKILIISIIIVALGTIIIPILNKMYNNENK